MGTVQGSGEGWYTLWARLFARCLLGYWARLQLSGPPGPTAGGQRPVLPITLVGPFSKGILGGPN